MITDDLAAIVKQAVFAARDAGEFTLEEEFTVTLETPRNKQHGDFSSNIALTLKKATGLNDSRDIAARILRHLPQDDPLIAKVDTAGPGFLNFYLRPSWLQDILIRIEREDACYGTTNLRAGDKVLIEFVSANPTGPISVVNGRAAALGDVLGNLLAAQGCEVMREFYINDALNSLQIEKFAQSCYLRYMELLGQTVDITGIQYPGDYVRDIAATIVAEYSDKWAHASEAERDAFFREETPRRMIAAQKTALESFGLAYDSWFYESSLYETGQVEGAIKTLTERGYTYEKDGALWLRSTAFGDSEDRVLVRSNEKATYIAADAAYHKNKFERGNTHLINIFGADHHGYVARLKASIAALGYDLKKVDVLLTQMVSLVRDGEAVIGGKRKGVVIELKEDLVDDIGRDAARFFFLLNSYETPSTIDVELAKRQSKDNPVYYAQYAHARLCNILRTAEERGHAPRAASESDRSLLTHESELDVLRKLTDYPSEVVRAAADYAPHRITHYALDLAGLLNVFYENCRVLPGTDADVSPELTLARLALVNGARVVLRNLLTLLGVSTPEKM